MPISLARLAPDELPPRRPITVTTIARTWDDGDDRRCRLCDQCWATDGICLVTANRRVDIE